MVEHNRRNDNDRQTDRDADAIAAKAAGDCPRQGLQ